MLSIKKIIIIVPSFLVLVLLYHIGVLHFLSRPIRYLLNPLTEEGIAAGLTTSTVIQTSSQSKQELTQEIRELRTKINNLQLQIINLQEVERENKTLRSLIEFQDTSGYAIVPASVTFKNNEEIARILTINKGTRHGIQKGNAVIIGTGSFIGTIERVLPESAQVRLSIDPKSTVLATLMESEHTIAGVLGGAQGTGLVLRLIPKNVPLFPAERVVTNGLQENIPRNLFLGEVMNLEENENEIFNSASIKPPYIMEDITLVGVVLP